MLCSGTNSTLVGRLRIRSRSSDPQAEQRHIARMLGAANLHPSSLPDSATLVVRRLADPLPGRLRVGRLHTQIDLSWESAVAATLERLAAGAARPAYGAVPAETSAVLFCDRAEILASLAKDWMSGTLAVQWWWRELFRGQDAVNALFREWIDSPQYVPAALDLLARQSRVVPFVQRLPQPAAAEILESVLRAYGVPQPRIQAAKPMDYSESRSGGSQLSAMTGEKTPPRMSVVPVWQYWVPEAANPGLDTMQKVLLIQAIMLRRAPATTRTLAFQEKLLQWQTWLDEEDESGSHATGETQETTLSKESGRKPSAINVHEQSIAQDNSRASAAADKTLPATQGHFAADAERRKISAQENNDQRDTEARVEISESAQASTHVDRELADAAPPTNRISAHGHEIALERDSVLQPGVRPDPSSADLTTETATTFETEHGGVFFLLSLALYLHIYGDFTMPVAPGLELNIWDFLALMGWELTDGAIEADPLWDGLAALAGRTKLEKPGAGFDSPNEWQLPSDWRTVFTEDYDSRPVLRNGRMVLEHSAGFALMDVPVDAQQIEPPEMRLKRWVGWMAGYFRARLVRSMGREDAVTLLCHRRARVALTLTHVDVTFALDHHPIEIRVAGLDRDPGWIPAAGRYVAFHFE